MKTEEHDYLLLKEIVSNLGGAIYVVQNNRIVFHNRQFTQLLGYSEEELDKLSFLDIVHPKDRKLISLLFKNSFQEIRDKSSRSYTFRILNNKGKLRWLKANVSIIPWEDGFALLDNCFDVTQQKEMEEKLVEEEQNFRLLVNGFEDMIFILNKRGVIVQANHSVYERLGHPEHKIDFRNFTSLFPSSFRPSLQKGIAKAFKQERVSINTQIQNIHNEEIPLEIRFFNGNWSQKEVVFAICQDITLRLEAEQSIRLSEEKFSKAFENNAVMMIISSFYDNRLLDANETFLKTINLKKDKVIGRQIDELKLFPTLEHIDSIKRRILDVGRLSDLETTMITPGGSTHIVNFSLEIIDIQGELCLLSIMTDITQKKQAEERIMLSEQRFRQLAHLLPEKVFEVNAKGYITFANQYLQNFFGYTTESFQKGVHLTELFDNEGQKVVKEYMRNSKKETELPSIELNAQRVDGTVFPTLTHIVAILEKGKLNRYMGVMVDISARKEQEREIIKAKEVAEKASMAKEQFLSTMSHEVRTPMNAVIGMTNILLEDHPLEHQLDHLRSLKYSAQGLMSLLNDVLDISKIEAGKLSVLSYPMNLQEVVQAVWHTHKHIAQKKGIELRLNMDSGIPENLLGDSVRISQVLTNLTSNAVKFTHEGYVNITLEKIDETVDSVSVLFSVSDTGIGIPLDKQQEIFEEFTQANHLKTREYGGTGLGLTISQKLVNLFNSEIMLESEPGKGSNFFFTITFAKDGDTTEILPKDRDEEEGVMKDGGQPYRILVVEDNEINSYIALRYLNEWGFETELAENGQMALDVLSNQTFDLILMDIEMPVMDGYNATKAIRQLEDSEKRSIPIIALTATAVVEVQKKILDQGMNDYIIKPFNPSVLKEKIFHILNG